METQPDETRPARLRRTPSWLLTQSAAQASRLVSEGFAAAGARGYHYALLAALEEFGPASQAALGRRCGVDRSDVVAALNALEGQGLVERAPDAADRRRNTITITRAGLDQLQRLDRALAGVQRALFAPLSEEEREQLAGLLERVLAHHAGR